MASMTASKARAQLFPLLEAVNRDHDIIRITSKAGTGVLMSEADYDAWQTTLYLLSTSANAAHLRDSIASWRAGGVRTVGLDSFDEPVE